MAPQGGCRSGCAPADEVGVGRPRAAPASQPNVRGHPADGPLRRAGCVIGLTVQAMVWLVWAPSPRGAPSPSRMRDAGVWVPRFGWMDPVAGGRAGWPGPGLAPRLEGGRQGRYTEGRAYLGLLAVVFREIDTDTLPPRCCSFLVLVFDVMQTSERMHYTEYRTRVRYCGIGFVLLPSQLN